MSEEEKTKLKAILYELSVQIYQTQIDLSSSYHDSERIQRVFRNIDEGIQDL